MTVEELAVILFERQAEIEGWETKWEDLSDERKKDYIELVEMYSRTFPSASRKLFYLIEVRVPKGKNKSKKLITTSCLDNIEKRINEKYPGAKWKIIDEYLNLQGEGDDELREIKRFDNS